jgi:hypothetical protein
MKAGPLSGTIRHALEMRINGSCASQTDWDVMIEHVTARPRAPRLHRSPGFAHTAGSFALLEASVRPLALQARDAASAGLGCVARGRASRRRGRR